MKHMQATKRPAKQTPPPADPTYVLYDETALIEAADAAVERINEVT